MYKLATFRGVSADGEPLAQVFHPGSSIRKLAGSMMPEIQQWLSCYTPDPNQIAVLVNAMGASEYWGQNVNGDIFPESALIHDCANHAGDHHPLDDFTGKVIPPYGYWTFKEFAKPYVHHVNKDPTRCFGHVALAVWNPRMHRVELIVILDKTLALQHGAQHVIDRIMAGEFPDVSMGCKVPYDICTICQHKSKTRKDYCNCVRYIGMGKILDDGRRIGVINTYPRFFDISFVFIGADKTAKVMMKLGSAQSGLWVPQSVLEGEWLYGADSEGGELIKAASARMPGNILYVSIDKKANVAGQATGAGTHGVYLAADDHDKGPVDPLLLSKEDHQQNEAKRSISDGALGTNADYNETDEFPEPLTPAGGGAGSYPSDSKGEYNHLPVGDRKPQEDPMTLPATDTAPQEAKVATELDMNTHYGSFKPMWDAAKKMTIGPPPSPNRKEYPFIGTINFRGLLIDVENKPGSVREGKSPKGKKWRTNMRLAYGEFRQSLGTDGDPLDVYVGPYRKAPNVYIIHQNFVRGPNKGKYDEDKVMIGFESSETAKEAYLAHYDSKKYFRSMTVMSFSLFKKALDRKEVHGEKVAAEMEKIAVDLKLEDLFSTAKTARRRQRTWRDQVTGKETNHTGSGFESTDMAKAAAVEVATDEFADSQKRLEGKKTLAEIIGMEAKKKVAGPLSIEELLKLAIDPKTASHQKWADIVKSIGPDKAVGRVSPALSDSEPSLPRELLNEMGSGGLEQGLSTPSAMGMVLKPREFQRSCLSSMGKEDLADKLDDAGAVFDPVDHAEAPCKSLDMGMAGGDLLKRLLPFMGEKSYFGPPVRARIIRITISRPQPSAQDTRVSSPLLSKVAAHYNWYRREQMKLATQAAADVPNNPELHAMLYGLSDEDMFSKKADVLETPRINLKTLGLILGAIPLTLMYSAHLRDEKDHRGKELGLIKNLIAEHPLLSTMGISSGLGQAMKSPHAQQAMDELIMAAKRIYSAGAPEVVL